MADPGRAAPILPPPRRPLAQRLIDIVLWGGILLVLLISFGRWSCAGSPW